MTIRVAFFIEGTFIPARDGASTRFSRLPAALSRSGLGVYVFHSYRGWSDLGRIALEPYPTYFFHPDNYHNDLNLIANLVKREGIDIIQMNDLETLYNIGLPLAHLTGVKLIYEALYHSSTLASQLGLSTARLEAIRFLERVVADTADHIIVLSEPDRQRWSSESAAPIERLSLVPFGVHCTQNTSRAIAFDCISVAFLGNGYFEPNRRAVERIVTDIWPALHEWNATLSCLVIGDIPPDLRSACQRIGIKLTGEVPDPGELLRDCAIGIAPVTEGSGIRAKLLDYLSAGLPAIATQTAAEGLEFPALIIENQISAYADVVRGLLADWRRTSSLVQQSLDILTSQYTWEHIARTAMDVYQQVMSQPSRVRPSPGPRIVDVPMWLDEAIKSGRFAGADDLKSLGYRYGVAGDGTVKMY